MNLHWFYPLYSMAVVFMIVGFLWQFAVIPLSVVVLAFNDKIQFVILYLIMLIPYYLMASSTLFIGLGENDGKKITSTLVIGGIFLLFHGLMGVAQAQNDARKTNDYEAYNNANNKYIPILLGLSFYIYSIFDNRPTMNWLTADLVKAVNWIQDIPVIGWIIAIAAFFYVVYMIFMGVAVLIIIIIDLFQKNKIETQVID